MRGIHELTKNEYEIMYEAYRTKYLEPIDDFKKSLQHNEWALKKIILDKTKHQINFLSVFQFDNLRGCYWYENYLNGLTTNQKLMEFSEKKGELNDIDRNRLIENIGLYWQEENLYVQSKLTDFNKSLADFKLKQIELAKKDINFSPYYDTQYEFSIYIPFGFHDFSVIRAYRAGIEISQKVLADYPIILMDSKQYWSYWKENEIKKVLSFIEEYPKNEPSNYKKYGGSKNYLTLVKHLTLNGYKRDQKANKPKYCPTIASNYTYWTGKLL